MANSRLEMATKHQTTRPVKRSDFLANIDLKLNNGFTNFEYDRTSDWTSESRVPITRQGRQLRFLDWSFNHRSCVAAATIVVACANLLLFRGEGGVAFEFQECPKNVIASFLSWNREISRVISADWNNSMLLNQLPTCQVIQVVSG